MPTVLVLLAEGYEEIETFTPVDLLRRAGVEVIIASLVDHRQVTGRNGITVRADAALAEIGERLFDLLFLPGGPGVRDLRADPRVGVVVGRHAAAGKWLAAICAAPTVLNDAGLLHGRRYTAHFSVADELPQILADHRVVADGNILTSRGAGTALDFGLLLVEKLFSEAKSSEIARSICA
jgi:protein deglycase